MYKQPFPTMEQNKVLIRQYRTACENRQKKTKGGFVVSFKPANLTPIISVTIKRPFWHEIWVFVCKLLNIKL